MRPGRRPAAWTGYLMVGTGAIAAYQVVAERLTTAERATAVLLYSLISLSAPAALLVGRNRYGARHPAWSLLIASQLFCWVGDTMFYVRADLLGLTGFPSVADGFYFLRYLPLLAALYLFLRTRSAERDLAGALDATIVTVAAALLSWTYLVEPALADTVSTAGRLGLVYQPVLDVAVLSLTLALTLGRGNRPPAFWLLLGSNAANLMADSLYGLQVATGTSWAGNLLDGVWLVGHLLAGACGLHPSMARLTDPGPERPVTADPVRLGLLALAALTSPVILLVQSHRGGHLDVEVNAAGSAVMFLLVLARLAGQLAAARSAAVTDQLTGLANRALFLAQLRTALARARRSGTGLAVMFLDVDRFTTVNDSLGHTAGDQLLRAVAERLRHGLRSGDVAARHGGDEFTLLVPDVPSPAAGWEIAERLRQDLDRPVVVDGQRVDVSVSIGLAVSQDLEDEPEDLLRHADAALYRAKHSGRNRVELFDQATRDAVRRRVSEEAELREAIEAGQIEAWFQPVVQLGTGRIVGGEALARWRHPARGVLLPGAFLPLAEEVGLVPWVSRSVAWQTWQLREDLTPDVPDDFRLSFNLGIGGEFSLTDIVDRVMAHRVGREAVAGGLTLEITERAVISDPRSAAVALAAAREAGFAVALDDFGTGHSSLSLLRDLPLDILKIDRTFVQRMADSRTDAAIVVGVLDLAARLGLRVVAEGVETDQEVDQLLAVGAELAQGFRYSPAVPAAEFTAWVRGHAPWQHPTSGAAPGRITAGGTI